jgi:hypothetical protein
MSSRTEQSQLGGFCGLFLNLGLARVGPGNVQLSRTMSGRDSLFVDALNLLELTFFTSSITPILIVRCTYTQEI